MADQEPRSGQTSSPTPTGENRLRAFFLGRLDYLVGLRDSASAMEPDTERLVKWALYSTYRDCLSFGVGDQARALLTPKPTEQTTSTEIPASGIVFEAPKGSEAPIC